MLHNAKLNQENNGEAFKMVVVGIIGVQLQ